MATKTTNEEQSAKKSVKKIKATTGAWWKSTVSEAETTEAQPVDKLTEQEAPAKKPARRPARKRSAPKTQPAPAAPAAEESTALEGQPAKKKPGRRAPRKKVKEDGAVTEQDQSPAEVAEKPKKSPRKSPRRKKKEDAVAGAETGGVKQEAAAQAEPASAGDEAATAQGVTPQQKKPAGRKPRRGRKPAAKDSQVAAKGEQATGESQSSAQETESKKAAAPQAEKSAEKQTGGAGRTKQAGAAESAAEEESKEKTVIKLLINAEEPEECRLALLENGRLESIHVSTVTRTQTKNNIYKGRIVAIEPNLQAAFVDYGTDKNGFLPFSEIHPEYYKEELSDKIRKLVDAHQWKRLSITDVVDKGQEVLVQVVKEEVGKKGANMTTYLSLPGRCVVLMPGSDSSGISRKISGEERRSQLREAMNSLSIPEGIGWIVRTASVDITKTALSRDVGYLLRLWEEVKKKGQQLEGVGQVYEDHQSVLRFLREHFDPSIEEILVDDSTAMEQVKEFIDLLPAKQRKVRVRLHKGSRPIFNQFSVEDQIESIYQPKVNLPSGGSIVIDPTEALVAIDVNSGSTSKGKNFDETIFQANMEAAAELARQLRLRDLGGLIVVDFIDMRSKKHIREVERQVKQAMKRDKAKVDISRISKFGLMQISRQKLGAPIEAGNYRVCQHCKGRGIVRSVETLALFYLRRIQTGASRKNVQRVECHFPLDVAQYLLNNKRNEVHELENKYHTEIAIVAETAMKPADNEILFQKAEKEGGGQKQG